MRLFILFCVLFSMLPQSAQARSVMEGFWTGAIEIAIDHKSSYKRGGERILEVQLIISSEFGHLTIEPDVVDMLVNSSCEYYFTHEEGVIKNIVLKPGAEGQICGDNPKIKLVRKDAETLFFSVQDSRMGLSETFPLGLRHGLIPEGVKSIIPENFTVFDIELGMLRNAAEERLVSKKYIISNEGSSVYSGPGWKQHAVKYEDGNNKIYVIYSAVSDTGKDFSQEYVVLISRFAEIPSSREVTFTAFSNSVSLKYGPKDTGDLNRFYNYDGVLIANAKKMICEESERQNVKVLFHRRKKFKGKIRALPDCGSSAEIYAKTNTKTGLVESYEITLWNFDMLIENDWRKVAYQTKENAELYLGRLSVDHVDIDL